ncbi:cysteine desulfurase [Butyrivibrio fibrisolvens DSM 3071]|uniref:cysteine desulfurase n=1 Tax=Butyrivibrio fibrisolvens DSM 3071 TaxID=1121131 RepID=A0A1M6FUC9_BUTFI|nr:cysteine desulfurase family protein [Butyrivibrio fibrisolvens]SHJ01292.1 cysteine desulfurase [Butyrivibrio fibrisolvens DSM 3071]
MIYLDHAATTRPEPEVVEAMIPFLRDNYMNPSAFYQPAVRTRMQVEKARRSIAQFINAPYDSIVFTSGGTESDNWAIRMGAKISEDKGKHIITTKIEHPAVLNTVRFMEEQGYDVTYLDVDSTGRIDLDDLKSAIREDTVLISIMHANNEIGTIQPIEEIGKIAHEHGILFHTDAVQTFGHIKIDVSDCNIDLLSASAHKLYGPKGIGLLYIRDRKKFAKLLFGGSQELGLRPGTENVADIIGFAKAVEIAESAVESDHENQNALREELKSSILKEIPGAVINENEKEHLPGTLNVTFPSVSAETILIRLDMNGICASAGSACSAGALEPSHVLTSIGKSDDEAKRTIRFSIGRENTKDDIVKTVEVLKALLTPTS